MSDAKTMRLSKVAKEFDLLGKITEFLAAKGRPVENNPNAKIGDEEYSYYQKILGINLLKRSSTRW